VGGGWSGYPVLMPFPLLTPRVSIEPLTMRDVDEFVRYRQDPKIARYQSWDTNFSAQQGADLVQSQVDVVLPATGNWLQLAIHDRETGGLLGDLALHAIDDVELTFEIGFTIARAHQGQGFAKESALRLMEYLFTAVGATKLIATTDNRNVASINLLVALEFERVPSKSWTENFKNEEITVDYFEKHLRN
jgi:RimJ/RimL family protein N-acetyltransferase